MAYLIDSDWLIDFLDDVPAAMTLLDQLASDGIAISVITYMEVYQGTERSPNPAEAQAKLRSLVQGVPVLPISVPVAERCGRLRATLQRQGKRVRARALDLLIAATALEYNLTLVTRNKDDYKDIPGLTLY